MPLGKTSNCLELFPPLDNGAPNGTCIIRLMIHRKHSAWCLTYAELSRNVHYLLLWTSMANVIYTDLWKEWIREVVN